MARKALLLLLALAAVILPLFGCRMRRMQRAARNPETLGDLAWDAYPGNGAVVYLAELPDRMDAVREMDAAGEEPALVQYAPFLVLTARPRNAALLLREHPLPDPASFNDYSAYYADSAVDRYLTGPYLSRLAALPVPVLDSPVEITTELSLGVTGTETERIERKVFLLSCTEVGETDLLNCGREGVVLKYFQDGQNRIALGEDGTAAGWWLRTPDTYYFSCPFCVGPDGSIGSGNAYNRNGVRPALRLDASARLEAREDIVPGKTVYTLAQD